MRRHRLTFVFALALLIAGMLVFVAGKHGRNTDGKVGDSAGAAGDVPFGISVHAPFDGPAKYLAATGKPIGAARVFLGALPKAWPSSTKTIPPGVLVSFSFKSAKSPAAVTAFERSRPAGTPCTGTYFHEPEDNLTTAAQQAAYRATWDVYGPAIRAGGCTPTLILMRWSLSPGSHRNWKSWYSPGAVDMLAFDAYNGGQKKTPPVYTDPAKIIDPIRAVAKAEGKTWALTETGSPILTGTTSADRAEWVGRLAAAVKAGGGQFADWWDQSSPGFDNTLDAAAARAWR